MDLKQQAKNVENSVNIHDIHDIKFIEDQLMLNHIMGEQNFDLEVSKIESSIIKDVKDELHFINKINDNIKKRKF